MQNPIKATYNFIKNLKQYHAVHALVIPHTVFFSTFLFSILVLPIFPDKIQDFWFGLGFTSFSLYIVVALFLPIYLVVITEIIILIIQFFKKEKILVKSDFLLNNKFYNLLFFLNLIIFVIIVFSEITDKQKFSNAFVENMLITPFFYNSFISH